MPKTDEFHSVNFTTSTDATFYDIMRVQAWLHPKIWNFTSTEHPIYGQFITSIGGLANDPAALMAWQYYILPEFPQQEIPDEKYRGTVAVDRVHVEDNKHYFFIYMGYTIEPEN